MAPVDCIVNILRSYMTTLELSEWSSMLWCLLWSSFWWLWRRHLHSLKNIYSTGITHDDCHVIILFIVQTTGPLNFRLGCVWMPSWLITKKWEWQNLNFIELGLGSVFLGTTTITRTTKRQTVARKKTPNSLVKLKWVLWQII